jgi:VCBS repeat-containing protein
MRPQTISRTLAAADDNGIATSQTPGGAGPLTLTATPVVLDVQRKVLITPAGADAARTFTVTGRDGSGNEITEDVAGANNPATSSSVLDFLEIDSVVVDAATAGAIEVGTSGVGASIMVPLDYIQNPFSVALGVLIDAADTVDVTVQFTFDDIRAGDGTGPFTWFDHPDLTNVTADADGAYVAPVTATRLLTNSGTDPAINRIIQAGHTST